MRNLDYFPIMFRGLCDNENKVNDNIYCKKET